MVQSIASRIRVMAGKYSPQTHFVLVLKRDALGLSLLLHHGSTLLDCLVKNMQQSKKCGRSAHAIGGVGRCACEPLVEAAMD